MAYYRGDYYRGGRPRGDYYMGRAQRGDPFWGAIVRGITSIGRSFLGIPSAAAAGTAVATAAAPATSAVLRRLPAAVASRLPSGSIPGMIRAVPGVVSGAIRRAPRGVRNIAALLASGAVIEVGGRLVDAVTGQPIGGARRRMNPANVKALRRSIRRVVGFGKLCQQARSSVGKAATQLQYGHRRRSSGGATRAMATASSKR